ncbi:AraC family transcriptional regulator [Paracoccus sp. PXZ]
MANQLTERLLFKWRIHSETGAPITCSNGVPLVPDAPLSEAPASDYVLVCGGVEPDAGCSTELTDWIRKQWRHGGTVGGLCTGAYALARAGILNNRRFTPAPMRWPGPASSTTAASPCIGRTSRTSPRNIPTSRPSGASSASTTASSPAPAASPRPNWR